MKSREKALNVLPVNMRDPETSERGVESSCYAVEGEGVRAHEVNKGRFRLTRTCERQYVWRQIAGRHARGTRRDSTCPIPRAARDFKDVTTSEILGNDVGETAKVLLPLRLGVNLLVLFGASAVVVDDVRQVRLH